ncbi:polymeric immunoglobulin receptor-like isoform X2 [Alosa sapidissima]|uniref:polymeric immunoglobulin receptor-like isoform X2 n=1 Tax=Alosa sapidissima TaxID=34773 RepID=UPI001C08ED08|nr:polymeric immunoglobulin receptor-like isoform X2 [Alosa sapidissima]
MKIVFVLLACLLSGGSWGLNLTEYAGRSIVIKCNYTSAPVNEEKYFCKEAQNVSCDEQIRSNVSEKWWQSKGRFSLYDQPAKGFIKVSMRNLTESDSGKYRCGVGGSGVNGGHIEGTEVYLDVTEGKTESRKPPVYEGYTGENISIKCPYDLGKYRDDMKYICKNEAVACTDRVRTGKKDQWFNPGKESRGKVRFYLYDNTTGGFFMVNITNLTTEDAGTYWCGVHISFQQNSPLSVDNLTEVILNVKNGSHKDDSKVTSLVCASLAVVALMFGVTLFICWQRRRNTRKGLVTDSNLEKHNNSDSGHRDCEYEEIQEPTHPLNRAGTEDNAVYANAQLPTNLSDNHTYSTIHLPTMQSDDATYSTARLPTMHSDNATYSMAQLPNMHSDNATYSMAQLPKMQSGESTYSTLQLPNNPGGDSTVTLPRNPTDCITYSTVQLPITRSA